jgi:integrase
LLFRLLYEHALRISECLSLTPGHVKRGYLRVAGKKHGKKTDERMNPETLALFESVTKNLLPGTLIFPFSRQWSDTLFHRYCDAAGIELQPRMGVHSLRHSCAHHMLDAGAPLPCIQRALRHRSLSSTSVYLEADASAVDGWRSKATQGVPVLHVHGTVELPAPLSLAAIKMEIERLSNLARAMQAPVALPVVAAPVEFKEAHHERES